MAAPIWAISWLPFYTFLLSSFKLGTAFRTQLSSRKTGLLKDIVLQLVSYLLGFALGTGFSEQNRTISAPEMVLLREADSSQKRLRQVLGTSASYSFHILEPGLTKAMAWSSQATKVFYSGWPLSKFSNLVQSCPACLQLVTFSPVFSPFWLSLSSSALPLRLEKELTGVNFFTASPFWIIFLLQKDVTGWCIQLVCNALMFHMPLPMSALFTGLLQRFGEITMRRCRSCLIRGALSMTWESLVIHHYRILPQAICHNLLIVSIG